MKQNRYLISTGRSRLDTVWHNREVTWDWLAGRLADTKRTPETEAEYAAMGKDARGAAKDVGGFVGGGLGTVNPDGSVTEGRRKAGSVICRSLVTLDIDYGTEDTVGIVSDALAGTAWCLYSTHSHTASKPRYRLIVPLDRQVTDSEYEPVARRIAYDIGMDLFDDSTYEAARLMYWPSTPKDGDFVFRRADGDPASADELLGRYDDWRDVQSWPVSSRSEKVAERARRDLADPLDKPGVIGAFCRTYGIAEAIDAFLPDRYERTATDGRWTYLGGSTYGGAVVYEDKWLYSHHDTDPVGHSEVNAFDLVRIHLFGGLDDIAEPGSPVNRLPSYLAMCDLAMKDPKVRMQVSKDNLSAADDFMGPDGDAWMAELEWTPRKGKPDMLANTPRNFRLVLENHPTYRDAVVYDMFSHERVLTRDLPCHLMKDGEFWRDSDDRALIQFFSDAPWYTQGKQNIIDSAMHVAEQRKVHPVRQYLEGLPAWDGVPRLETLVIDYLGAQDNELNRVMTRKHFCAAVRRIYEPGCKHDGVLCFDGPEGIGKSTLIAKMFGKWFSDTSISVDKANETGLALQGTWGKELAELTDYKKSTVEAYKSFISSTEDKVRVPYDRSYQYFKRQCVLFATTNDRNFLKGDTGNRRFWIIPCGDYCPSKDIWNDLPGERDQIWAEALAKYRAEDPELGPLEAVLRERQAGHNELADDIRVGVIRAYMEDMVPADWVKLPRALREEWYKYRTVRGIEPPEESLIRRPPVCYQELAIECLKGKFDGYAQKNIRSLLAYVGVDCIGTRRDAVYGAQKRFELLSYTESPKAGDEAK